MSLREQNIDLYDAYLKGELSVDDNRKFDQRSRSNPEFSKDFMAYQEEVAVIKALGIREEMAELMAEEKPRARNKLRYLIPLGVAAALMAFVLFRPVAPRHERLFQEYFEPYPNTISGRDVQEDLYEAINLYDREEYELALEKLATVESNDQVAFYTGICQLALDRPGPSIESLRAVSRSSVVYGAAQWYMALAFLKLDQPDSTRRYLNIAEMLGEARDGTRPIRRWID